ncbi:Peptidase M20 domain-containing protein 2 [Termitomyces sp. J132]|nr:Peptidase M20 domain-containing protein 2 [Termitomyces sp. J132]
MEKHGFEVTNHYHLETAWRATFTNREGGRTIGVNSEMDALPGVGHACGHNLIAISGVGVSIAIKKALEKFNLPGTVELLGTPAEEVGSGKVVLLDKGAYQNMDACLMCHPAPGPVGSVSLSGSLALEKITVEFTGHTAHAALSPWEGRNAHDAAVLSYNNVSALRQQLLPSHRIHGIFEGKDWTPNIIPDYSKMNYYVRAPTRSEVKATMKRVIPCFEAAALATGCKVKVTTSPGPLDLRQNSVLGGEVANITTARYGDIDYEWGIKNASTDFGDVCYALPSLHPGFAIPTIENGGNHTSGFKTSAASLEAHYACLDVTKALAATGIRVLIDDVFFSEVKKAYDNDAEIQDFFAGK